MEEKFCSKPVRFVREMLRGFMEEMGLQDVVWEIRDSSPGNWHVFSGLCLAPPSLQGSA